MSGLDPAAELPPQTSTYGRGAKRARPARPARPSAVPGGPMGPDQPPGRVRRRRWGRITLLGILCLILLLIIGSVGTWFWASAKVTHLGPLADYPSRPAAGAGTNWLVTGSDSRSTMTSQQKQQLHTGSSVGQRTDTIMLLHYGASGPDLISLPRDSYVTIPAYTDSTGRAHTAHQDKINAAYDLGGAQLLVRTVELATGVRIDHYVEIGFLGIVNMVDATNGVHMCLPTAINDHYSGANLPAGCQNLDGTQALAFVRSRYSLPNSDISRMANQQQFISSLANAALRPGVLLNPFALYPFVGATLGSIAVDDGTGLSDLTAMASHCGPLSSGKGTVGTVPISNEGHQVRGVGSTVLWNSTGAAKVFAAVNQDQAVPTGLLNTIG
jgi:LCP family protein required for cell wall assembly